MTKSLTALALFALTIVIPAAAYRERDDRTPDLGTCQQLRVEAGNRVALHAYAEGVPDLPMERDELDVHRAGCAIVPGRRCADAGLRYPLRRSDLGEQKREQRARRARRPLRAGSQRSALAAAQSRVERGARAVPGHHVHPAVEYRGRPRACILRKCCWPRSESALHGRLLLLQGAPVSSEYATCGYQSA